MGPMVLKECNNAVILHCVPMVMTTFNTTLPAAERYASGGAPSVFNVYCILLFQQLFPPKQQV
jgi:hypothetical protein